MNDLIKVILNLTVELKAIKMQLEFLKKPGNDNFKGKWVDSQDVLIALNISKRKLQSMRDNGTIPYSRIGNKFYYKLADLEKLLNTNYSNPVEQGGQNGTD